MIATDHKTTVHVSLPELGTPCIPGNTYQLRWSLRGEHADTASIGIELHYDQGVTLFLATDLPADTSSWSWSVGDIPSGVARITIVARDSDGNVLAMGETQQFVVAGSGLNGAALSNGAFNGNTFSGEPIIANRSNDIEAGLVLPPPIYPYPFPTPVFPPVITSIQPNQVIAGTSQNFVTIYGSNLPQLGYTVVNNQGLPILGTGTALADSAPTPTKVRIQVFLSPDIQSQGGAIRVTTNGGSAQFPITIIGTFQLPQIDYLDPNPLYVYPSSVRQSLQLIVGGKALPTVSSQIRLEGAPYGVSYGGLVFPNPSSDVIRINVEPFLASGTYFFDVVANTARMRLKLIKF